MLDSNEAIFQQEGETLDQVLDALKAEETIQPETEKEEKDNSSDSPTEENQEAETQSSEGDKKEDKTSEDTQDAKDEPFHIRWREQKNKLENEFQEKLDAQSKEFEQKLQALKPAENQQVPNWVKKIYGDSEDGKEFYKEWRAEQDAERAQFKQQIFDEAQKVASKQEESEKHWQGWVKEQLDGLKEEGKNFDRNKLMKVATEYMPTDEDGNISFKKAYAIYEKLEALEARPEKAEARRKLAAVTTDSKPNTTETKTRTYETPETIRNKSWFELGNS